jgi:hypothetical protein
MDGKIGKDNKKFHKFSDPKNWINILLNSINFVFD